MKKFKTLTKCIATFMMTAAMVLGTIPFSSEAASIEGFRWLGRDGSAQVNTGLGNGTENACRWWVATDKNDRGSSKVILSGNTDPIEHGAYISDEDVKKSGGICGTATLGNGYDYPYIYIGFNVVGLDSKSKAVPTDVSDWGGISIAYESDTNVAIALSMGDDLDKNEVGYDVPEASLKPTGGECKVVSLPWNKFTQGGWGTEKSIDDIVTSVAAIRFQIEGVAGTECHFKIIGIGSKDADLSGNYNVTFNTNGGSTVEAQSVKPGEKAVKPSAPTKSGCTFAGWYKDSAFTTPFNFEKPITEDTVVYAAWNEGSTPATYSVTFNTDGGSEVTAQNIMSGFKATKPANPTKSGNVFTGWYADSALKTPFDFSTPITKDTTIYAKWTAAADPVTYMVVFNSNGGGFVSAQSVKSGEKAVKPADPVKEGFTFGGWYKDSECKTAFDFNTPITELTMVYAKWNDPSAPESTPTPESDSSAHTVTFITNGGSKVAAQKVAHGKKVTYPDEPTKEGYKFEGWYSDSALTKPFEFNDPITDDIMVYAKWSENGKSASPSPTPAAKGTALVDEKGKANYVVLSEGKTDAADPSKNEMPTVSYTGTTNKSAKKITVPDTVTLNGLVYRVDTIGVGALKGNKKITTVTIGKNVKVIEKNAFAGCTKLKTVNCKSEVLYKIGANAFKGDGKLTKMTLKTTKLKKSKVGSNAIKGTSKKLKISAPKKVRKSYQKIFKAKGNKKVKVK